MVSTVALLFIFCAVAFLINLLGNNKPLVEGYGGPIKNIKRIPKDTCYNLCDQYFNNCMRMNRYSEGSFFACDRARESCISTCNYSSHLRL